MLQRLLHVTLAVVAAAGFSFAAVSTSDFTAHLDRQVHGIHCSFVPGADTPDVTGTSGCHATLMSPYSSVLRDSVWGGIPVSLPAMAVFAYLFVCAIVLVVLRKEAEPRAVGYQLLAWGLPLLTSIVFGFLSLVELGAACKLCIAIYAASALGFTLALVALVRSRPSAAPPVIDDDLGAADTAYDERVLDARSLPVTQLERSEIVLEADRTLDDHASPTLELDEVPRRKVRLATASEMDRRLRAGNANRRRPLRTDSDETPTPTGVGALALAFAVGVAFVALPVGAYAAGAPDFERYVGTCGTLLHPEDEGRVLVPIGDPTRAITMIEILDPLCASCRGFERRFAVHPAAAEVSRRVLLFPLDSECNRMLDTRLHPGACTISEAVLCADGSAEEVLAWAFDHQEQILEEEAADPGAARRMVEREFPALRGCIGSDAVRAELNRSLRWAVANQLPVLTPQVYVDGTRICDEDTDLGLDFVLSRLTARAAEQTSGRSR